MTFICPSCKEPYEAEKNKYRCKECRKKYDASRYAQDRGIGKTHSKEFYQKKQQYIREAKSKPCADCKISYPYYVMDFDHLPNIVKVKDISRIAASGSFQSLIEEIEKCEVVCANCHRERTQARL